MKTSKILFASFAVASFFFFTQCKKEAVGADKTLLDKTTSTTGFTYYKGDNAIKASSSESPHNKFFRVRFNSIAQAVLTDNGKLPTGTSFPEGSLIVKELYDSQTGALQLYAVMEKAAGDANSAQGWLWAEFDNASKVVYSVDKKGSGCTGCHSSNARDYVRLFNLFP